MPTLPETNPIPSTVHQVGLGAILLILASSGCIAQTIEIDTPDAREEALLTAIERLVSDGGPSSESLIGPVTALSLFLEETGAYSRADESIERVLRLVRTSVSADALEQAPGIRRLIRNEEQRGNAETAWDLEQALLALAEHHPDDPRSARILWDAADKRMGFLARYEAGELPAEILLGCYYDASATYDQGWAQSSRPADASSAAFSDQTGNPFDVPFGKPQTSCANGSRTLAREAIEFEAQVFYIDAANILLRDGEPLRDDLPDLIRMLAQVSYLRRDYAAGRRGLENLLANQTRKSADVVARINTMLLLGDWHLVWAQDLGTKLEKLATRIYLDAYMLARENDVAQPAIDNIFPSDVPIVVPTFLPNPLISFETATSTGFIDASFIVTGDGKVSDFDVLDSTTDATRSSQKDLERLVKRSRFRPVVAADGIVDEAPMTIRYYLNE